jgi:uncharacterized protein YecT (DUF1311 family)
MKKRLKRMKFMNKPFTSLIIAGLGTILFSASAQAARLAFDAAGNLFVPHGDSVLKFTSDGKRSTFASGLNDANDMAFDDKGNLFVRDGNTIFKFTPEGVKSTFASGVVPETYEPYHVAEVFTNLALDRSGNLFVAEHVSGSILKFTPDGKKSTFASGVSPYKMAVDGAGNLFVTQDVSSNLFVKRDVSPSIFKFTPEGKKSTLASGVSPDKMAVDGAGNLFAADGNTIFKFTPDGKKSTFATGINPGDLVFDRAGNLFVTDPGIDSILKFTPDGKKSTFGISYPGELAFDAAGNLFVFESASDLIFKFTPDGTRSTLVSDRVSPDKQWEYHSAARIVKAGTSQTVLDLSESDLENAKIVWAPDSKRFAFNYKLPCKHCTYDTIAFYQLRDDKWVALRALVDQASERTQLAQLAKEHLPKSARRQGTPNATHDLLKVREWIDANTAILYAYSQWFVGDDQGDLDANFLFTLKFDAEGNWKIVKSHQMSKKEIEKEDAGEDVSGPAQTTDQEKLSADASFRDADRQLNEVYNALRARLSPSERDTLKKEQRAWIDRRNAAGQLAKGNAEGNPTDAADREVTKMTLARAAELEKRLKKAK